jgi:asparagine synthase (glutamine-hydrolysing)
VREFVHDTLLGPRACGRGLFDPTRVEAALGREQAFGRAIWGLLCLELWLQAYIDT